MRTVYGESAIWVSDPGLKLPFILTRRSSGAKELADFPPAAQPTFFPMLDIHCGAIPQGRIAKANRLAGRSY